MRIALVALNALPAIDPKVPGPIGGIETRAWLLAQGLARLRDLQVQLIVRHTQPLLRTDVSGVELVPLLDPLYPVWQDAGQALERRSQFPWLRVRRWNPRLLWQLPRLALDRMWRGRVYDATKADPRLTALAPDVYVTFGVQTHSAVVIRSAQAAGRPSVLCLGSDGDLDPLFEPGGRGVDPYGTRAEVGRFILSSADRIVAQTPEQQRRLSAAFARSSTLLRNPIDVAAWEAARQRPFDSRWSRGLDRYVLWVGRAEELHKRPQLCLEVARRRPDVSFLMILNPRDPAVAARIHQTAPLNVRIIERVPSPEMPAVFARAAAFLSTSQLEGFPNVFLQAALSGVPIASLEVGGEFLAASGAGECAAGDLDRLADLVTACWTGAATCNTAAVRAYLLAHHALDSQVGLLIRELRTVAELGGRRDSGAESDAAQHRRPGE